MKRPEVASPGLPAGHPRLWLGVVAGVVSGIVTSVVASTIVARRQPRHPTATEIPVQLREDLHTLARVAGASTATTVTQQPTIPALADQKRAELAEADPGFAVRMAAEGQRHEREFKDKLAAHEYEARDAAWAENTSRQISADLSRAGGDAGFTVQSVDCRSETCVANLEWPSPQDAIANYGTALAAPLGVSCETLLVLSPSATTGGPFRAPMHLRCRR